MQHWFHTTIVETGRLPLFVLLTGFLVSFLFIRFSVRMIRAEVRWWPGNVAPGGLHVHHVIFGLVGVLLAGTGMVTLASATTPIADCVLAGLFGIGAALVLDEWALVLYLDDVYWAERGRSSVDAIFVAVAVMGLFMIGFRPIGFDGTFDSNEGASPAELAVSISILAVFAALAIITLLKGKLWTGLVGLFVVPLLIVGSIRVARPGSPWARWFYGARPGRMARAVLREQRYRQPVVRAKIAVQEALSGRFGELDPPAPATALDPADPAAMAGVAPAAELAATAAEPAPSARRVQEAGGRLANAIRWRRTRRRLRRPKLWRLPAVLVGIAVVLALLLTDLDDALASTDGAVLSGMDAGSTATLLGVIAGGMLTLAGLVFTALTLAMQFGASQLSIRVVPMLQQSPIMRWAIGMFLATFTYALIIALDLATSEEPVRVFSSTLAMLLAVASILVFVGLVTHVASVLNPASLLGKISDQGRAAISRMFPAGGHKQPAPARISTGPVRTIELRFARTDGRVLLAVNGPRIARLARRWGVTIMVEPVVGDFVSVGSPLFTVDGPQSRVRPLALERCLVFGDTHSPDVSPSAALQAIADIALKALSPAVNDPSRAVQAIDYLEDQLMLLSTRAPATAVDGEGAVYTRPLSWEAYVGIAVDEIRHFATDSLMVQRRLRELLENLLRECSADRLAPLQHRLTALDELADERWHNALDAQLAHTPDRQGLGRTSSERA